MQTMANPGIVSNGITYTDGGYTAVDYTDWSNLTSAISQGPVKLGMAADQLSNTTAGQANGWYATGWTKDTNEDHCTGLWLFGTPAEIYDVLKMPVPAALQGTTLAEFLGFYTWSTVGCIDFESMVNVSGEAWLRTPTTPQEVPVPTPTPIPPPSPTPTPSPLPATAVWIDKPSKTIFLPTGWNRTTNNVNPTIVVHPGLQQVDVPTGWNIS